MADIIQYTQVMPHSWHIDLVHHVHRGGSDGSLSNHRSLSLVEVFRKVVTSVICDRMKRDFVKLAGSDQPGVSSGTHDGKLHFPAPLGRDAPLASSFRAGHIRSELSPLYRRVI